MRKWVPAIAFAGTLLGAAPLFAQTADRQTLADIRQDMIVLKVELTRLQRELSTTGADIPTISPSSITARTAAIENELTRLTAQIETLEYRIAQIVKDGTNRLDDLQFRLCELTPECDLSSLDFSTPLGGAQDTSTPKAESPDETAPQLAIGEEADLAAARQTLESENYPGAITALNNFFNNYPASPLTAEAQLYLGHAHAQQGDYKSAAKAYLDSYTLEKSPPTGDAALTQLGMALGQLAQFDAACKTLSQLEARYPNSAFIAQAQNALQEYNCAAP